MYESFLWVITFSLLLFSCSKSSELSWQEENDYRWAEVSPGFFGSTGFNQLDAAQTNVQFNNQLSEDEYGTNRNFLIGSGVATGDIDGDGLVDVYFAGLGVPNKLYKNLGGMKFEDITERAGVAHKDFYSTGVVFADINGNGHLDLLVTSLNNENVLYINGGQGIFTKKEDSGLGPSRGSTTMALADITGNGYLDLYITNYKEQPVNDKFTSEELEWENVLNEPLRDPGDTYSLASPFDQHYELLYNNGQLTGLLELGEVDDLYLNDGGSFTRVEDTKEIFLDEDGRPFGLQPDWGLTAKFQDLTGNGLQDLYVCNDFFTPDRIWINQGNGRFKAIKSTAIRNISYSCMGVDFSDINRDGEIDIFTTEMLSPYHEDRLRQAASEDPPVPVKIGEIDSRPMYNRNSMHLKREDDTWAEITNLTGTQASGWSWATNFMDVNLDGFEDIIINTGFLYDHLDIDSQINAIRRFGSLDENFLGYMLGSPKMNLRNIIFKNNGNLTFSDVSREWGMNDLDISHGMAIADLNNDGTLDFVTNRMNKQAGVFQNTTKAPRIGIKLKGQQPNTFAIGANVEVNGGPGGVQNKQVTAGGEYASGSDTGLMFAADKDNSNHKILVEWPDGRESYLKGIKANTIIEIDQKNSKEVAEDSNENSSTPLFRDITDNLNHAHYEDPFADFELQALLPIRLSQMGPGISWIDITGNGYDDLLIGSGKGGKPGVYRNLGNGEFEPWNLDIINEVVSGDQTTLLGWKEDSNTRVVIGSANYEQGRSGVASAYLYIIDGSGNVISIDSLAGVHSTTGPLTAADITGNGYLDLFIGGSFKPGQYPEDADSRLYRNEEGRFVLDRSASELLNDLGLVKGAVFSDLTRNGNKDLLISNSWGSLRLFENTDGKFREITKDTGLDKYKGWWHGVATGDFTGNGRPDIIASNIGLNSQYQIEYGDPIRMYYDDIDGFGSMDIIEAYSIGDDVYVPRKKLHVYQQQQINLNRTSNHREFANSTVREILGNKRYEQTPYKEINTTRHMIFLNTENGFEARDLPIESQFTAGFSIAVSDVNNDGHEDLFLSQNLFAFPPLTPRLDAGRGQVLLGDGNGGFKPMDGTESGVRVYGEQRGAAFSDVNGDGKVDLVVSQNGAKTRLFLNQAKNSGFRISLAGPLSNENGVGSEIRLVYENGYKGPIREIQSGSGYWSQNSAAQIMAVDEDQGLAKALEIKWFDGTIQTVELNDKETYTIVHPDSE